MAIKSWNYHGTIEYVVDAEADLASIPNPRRAEVALALAEGSLWFHTGSAWQEIGGGVGGSGVDVEENNTPVGTATTLDFGTGLDVAFAAGEADITVDLAELDHGSLGGMTDDDHPQYAAIAQNETITGDYSFAADASTDTPVDISVPNDGAGAHTRSFRVRSTGVGAGTLIEISENAQVGIVSIHDQGVIFRQPSSLDLTDAAAAAIRAISGNQVTDQPLLVQGSIITVRSTGTELILEQTGDTLGDSALKLRNRTGLNGALFETTGPDLVDFAFKPPTAAQSSIRYEGRASDDFVLAPEFQIGLAADPGLVVANNKNVAARGSLAVTTAPITQNGKNVLDTDHTAAADPHTGYVLESLIDAKGDLIGASAADTPARVPVGANGTVLTADSGVGAGVSWQTPGAGSHPDYATHAKFGVD